MPQTFKHEGVIYEDLGNGNVRVVGYDDAPSAPQGSVFSVPKDPTKAAMEQAQLDKIRQDMEADARQEARTISAAERSAAAEAQRLDFERQRLELARQSAQKDQPGKQDMASVRAEALDKIRLARSLQDRSKNGWFTTGFGSAAAGYFRGSPAYDLKQDTETLKNAGALTRIMEMAKTNGGKNPLTPLSNSDFQALASSLSNLETGQSDEQYQANVQRVIDLYTRAYQGAGGTDIEGELDPKKKRRDGAALGAGAAVNGQTPNGFDAGGGGGALATGGIKTVRDPNAGPAVAALQTLLRSGAPDEQVRAAATALNASPASVKAALDFRRKNPGYRGAYNLGDLGTRQEATTAWNRLSASPLAAGAIGVANGLTGGSLDEIAGAGRSLVTGMPLDQSIAGYDAMKKASADANWKSSLAGNVIGSGVGLYGASAAARTAGLAAQVGRYAPHLGAAAFGAATGALEKNDNRLLGGAVGAGAGVVGQVAGDLAARPIGAALRTDAGRRLSGMIFGRQLPQATAPTPAGASIATAARKAGVDDVRGLLTEARDLGLPMSLADTHPELRELAGAAVRRSPTAASLAEDTLIPRNRGQIDRLGQAVTRDLGPVTNIPQMAADMTERARIAAGPLYERAYAQPVVTTPELEATLNTPFGRQAVSRARTIAANERRDPTELGFALDAEGNTILNPQPNRAIADHLVARAELDAAQEAYRAARNQPGSMDGVRDRLLAAREAERNARQALNAAPDPSKPASVPGYTTQTLDYTKRGMDDVLEAQRNPITGRLVLDEAGRAQNQVRTQFLREVDKHNPAYADARNAYAGPVQARDALTRGQDAFSLTPDELTMQVGTQSPEHLAQMQLGYRAKLMETANQNRFSTNPFESTLGTPAAEQRLNLLYPNNPGNATLLRTRDLERGMAQTTNAILGNSKTAQRQIADDAFLEKPAVQAGVDIGANLLAGGMPVTTLLRTVASSGVKDAFKLGRGKRGVAKAEAMAPDLLNLNPEANLATLDQLIAGQDAYARLVAASRPKRLGMFFSGPAIGTANQAGR